MRQTRVASLAILAAHDTSSYIRMHISDLKPTCYLASSSAQKIDAIAAIRRLPKEGESYIDFPNSIDIVYSNYKWSSAALLRLKSYAYPDNDITISNLAVHEAYQSLVAACSSSGELVGGQVRVKTSSGIVFAEIRAAQDSWAQMEKYLYHTYWLSPYYGERFKLDSVRYATIGREDTSSGRPITAFRDGRKFMNGLAVAKYLIEDCLYVDGEKDYTFQPGCRGLTTKNWARLCSIVPWGCIFPTAVKWVFVSKPLPSVFATECTDSRWDKWLVQVYKREYRGDWAHRQEYYDGLDSFPNLDAPKRTRAQMEDAKRTYWDIIIEGLNEIPYYRMIKRAQRQRRMRQLREADIAKWRQYQKEKIEKARMAENVKT